MSDRPRGLDVAEQHQLSKEKEGEDDNEHRGGDAPRGPRRHLFEVCPVAQQQEEETLGRERELRNQAFEFLQPLVVVVAAPRGQPPAPVGEMWIVKEQAATQHEDERRKVQRLARGVEEHDAGDERQKANVPVDPVEEEKDRRRDEQRDRKRDYAAAEEIDREIACRALRVEPGVEHEHADDVRQRALVDHELARLGRKARSAWNRDCAADH